MGRDNRQRRAAKKRQRARQARRPPPRRNVPPAGSGASRTDPAALDALVWLAAHLPPGPQRDGHLAELRRAGRAAVEAARRHLERAVGEVWTLGYSPSDLLHVLGRAASPAQVNIAAAAVLSDPVARGHGRRCTRWAQELQGVADRAEATLPGLTALDEAVELLAQLWRLDAVPAALPVPGSDGPPGEGRLDARVLARVRALLRKAESTGFDEEAEALTAKAQELITRHALDRTRLQAEDGPRARPRVRRILLHPPYVDPKALLVSEVADANRCRAVYSVHAGWCTVFGFDADLDATELLVASLLAQALRAQARHGAQRDRYGRSRTRSFRRSFLQAFAVRIGQRLRAADAGVVGAAPDRDQLLPALRGRVDAVHTSARAAFPQLVDHRVEWGSNAAGWVAGTTAADLAALDTSAGALTGAG